MTSTRPAWYVEIRTDTPRSARMPGKSTECSNRTAVMAGTGGWISATRGPGDRHFGMMDPHRIVGLERGRHAILRAARGVLHNFCYHPNVRFLSIWLG